MANKAFEVQDSKIRIGGVDLEAGTTGVVIPGVTQATNYRVEEVEDTDVDQTYQFAPNSAVVVIDKALYDTIVAEGNVSTFADFSVELDDDGYIDEIEVNGQGTYSAANADRASLNDMYAYVGAGSASDRPLVPEDWITIPFRPKMRAGDVETIGGGSGGAIVEREVSFPNGDEGDTRGTIALTPDGETYVCTDDWVDASESLQGTFTAVTNVLYNINQSGGSFNSASLSIQDEPEIYNILRYGNWNPGELTIDAGPTWGGVQNVDSTGYNDQAGYMTLLWLYRQGDPQEIPLGTSVTITFTGSGSQPPIWRRLVDLTAQGGGEDGEINWRSEGDLTIETFRPEGYDGDCDLNLYAADDVWIEAKGDELELRAVSTVSIQVQGDGSWIFQQDGSIALPDLENTGWENGYTLNAPTLMLGGELNNPPQQVVITGPRPNVNNTSAERLIIQGQKGWGGENETKGEGGDIYLWAGVGGDGGAIDSQGGGGDIKVRGGQGGAGGYVKVEGGDATGPGGTGGYIEITAGDGTNVTSGDGGDVRIKAGAGSGTGNNGEVHVYTVGTNNHWIFKNDGALQLPVGGDIRDSNGVSVLGGAGSGAELVGDGGINQVGDTQIVYTDYQGNQAPNGGPTATEIALTNAVSGGFAVGDVITFRTGEVREITQVNDDTPSEGFRTFTWVGDVEYSWNDPMFPITVVSADYAAATKPTARIKPDSTYEGLGQWVDIYTGGGPSSMDDLGHIHMKGHHGNVELFLGTDDNFVSTKEAGNTPGHVTMRSESEIKVIETDLRTHRNGSTFISDMGDSENYTWHRTSTADISHNTVAVDANGNYYIGGEHHDYADGMVSKFSKDGSLIWSKIFGGDGIDTAFDVPVVAVNPTTDRATILYTTDLNRGNLYFKMVDLDADGNFDGDATDFYDEEGGVRPRDMKWHPTLGWVIVGETWGDELNSGTLSPQTGSGVGKLVLNAANTDLRGPLMTSGDNSWRLSGTNISGKQVLDQGIGLFTGLTPTNLLVDNPAAGGAVIKMRINYSGSAYFGLSGSEITSAGTDYTSGDIVKIPGSQLGGVDGFTVDIVDPVVVNNNPSENTVTIKAPKLNHAVLDAQVGNGSPVIGFGIPSGSTISNFRDFDVNYWAFDVVGDFTPTGTISVLHLENDAVFTVSTDGLGGINGTLTTTGTPELTNITISMTELGFTTEDFSTGSYTVYKQVGTRPFVWTTAWKKFLDVEEGYNYGYAVSVAVNVNDIDAIYVSGYTEGSRNGNGGGGFLWKLNSAGATSWIRGLDNQWEISNMAVAANGEVYAASQGMANDITHFANNGLVINRIQPSAPFGGRLNVDIARGEDGQEYVYAIWGEYNAMGLPMNGMAVQKFTMSLEQVWSRTMVLDSGVNLNVNYENNYRHFALTPTQAVVVGYAETLGNSMDDGQLWSMSITDDFEPTEQLGGVNGITTSVLDMPWEAYGNTASDNLTSVLLPQTSTLQTAGAQATFSWNPYTWSNRIINANFETKGLVGIEKIDFVQGGYLGHNPADVPHSSQNLQANDSMNWNITLNLLDRGKFIKNMAVPTHGNVQDLKIYVPKTSDVAFPVGSIITLINLDTTDNYWIDVEPVGFNNDSDAPLIWANGQTISGIWGFKGLQTATLMKIGTNDWLLTASNITDRG